MSFDSILQEAEQLESVSTRLEGLADQHPTMTEGLLTIAGMFTAPPHYSQCW
jgi:hypothetical protein